MSHLYTLVAYPEIGREVAIVPRFQRKDPLDLLDNQSAWALFKSIGLVTVAIQNSWGVLEAEIYSHLIRTGGGEDERSLFFGALRRNAVRGLPNKFSKSTSPSLVEVNLKFWSEQGVKGGMFDLSEILQSQKITQR